MLICRTKVVFLIVFDGTRKDSEIQRPNILLFTRGKKSVINEIGKSGGHVQKVSRNVCTSAVVISPDPLSYSPSTSSAVKTPENIKHDPESSDKGAGIL